MRTIKLYGHLGKTFGRTHKFDVKTPAEAIRALRANFPTFEQHVLKHNLPGYKITIGGENRSKPDTLHYPADNDIKIIPVIQGAGGNGSMWGMIVIGVVLIAASIATAGAASVLAAGAQGSMLAGTAAGASVAATATTLSTVATAMMAVGTSLVLSGVSSLLFSPTTPSAVQNNSADQISSTHFNGAINLTQQGNPIPIAYGRVRVGSQVVSAGITTSRV